MANKSPTHYLCTVKLSLLYLYKFLRYKNFKNKLFCGIHKNTGGAIDFKAETGEQLTKQRRAGLNRVGPNDS